ncbi:AEC family transporter [uncultured Parasphingorhabdus sp.]|uniref:AEC family transporter n=1 Tax=uncultured Parasphingorhabdus sp. TaxID=2709694 RepID=UPI002AA9408D|nr:AEC family transporter [uncultured Parasphingorhabdus sp.]
MINFIYALIPVILITGLGWLLAQRNFLPAEGWRAIERLVYFLFFPALIINVLTSASFEIVPWTMVLALIGSQMALAILGLVAKRADDGPRKGSIIQSNVRWNTFVGLSIASALFGEPGLALMAIAVAVLTPVANVVSVLALTYFAEDSGSPKPHVMMDMIRNPLIIGCIVGIALNLLDIAPTGMAEKTLDILGEATLALGLLVVGAAVDLKAFNRAGPTTLIWSAVRLLGFPVAALAAGLLLNLAPDSLAIVVIAASTPTASSGYILARQLGGDATLSANLIAVQTVFSVLSMPAIYALYLLVRA